MTKRVREDEGLPDLRGSRYGPRNMRRGGGGAYPTRDDYAAAAALALTLPGARNTRTGGYIGIEKKFVDYEYEATVASTLAGSEADPTELAISAIAQGDGQSNRDGRRCVLRSVHVKGFLAFAPSGATSHGPCRIVVLLDTQTNGAQFNAEDVFVDPTDTSHDAITFRNLQYQKRFRVLGEFSYDLNSPGGGATPMTVSKSFQLHKEFKSGIPVEHTGTTAAVASISDNSIHVLAVCGTGVAAQVTLRYYSRVRFVG